jgi:protease-4
MSATADLVLERRRARRRLAFWRILAIVAIVIALVAIIPRAAGPATGEHIARLRIDGVIFADPGRDALIDRLAEEDSVKAVMVHINSPGGTVAGSEALYENLRRVAEKKPVVAVMSEAAASGGYLTAIAAEHIVARATSLTGSIGVIAQIPNVTGLMEKLGIDMAEIKSAPLKGEPSVTHPIEPGAIEAQERLIEDTFQWFRDIVSERRGLTGPALEDVTDGRVFTGRQALERGLIDAIGGEEKARDWLAETHGIGRDMAVADRDWRDPALPWPLGGVGESLAAMFSTPPVVYQGPRLYAVVQ